MSSSPVIRVVGARVHNLKNINVEIPRDKFVVITGLSGSGKSSLAFDTIFAEGQRRYVESLSSYARQFLGQMDKPDVDYIEGLSPAVSIDQRATSRNPRSTVGTVTEIYDYLRLLFARAGIPHCPECGREVAKQSAQEIVETVESIEQGARILILAPVVRGRKGTYQATLDEIQKSGFLRVRVDGTVYNLEDKIEMDRYKIHFIEAVVDRLVIRKYEDHEEAENFRTRLTDSIETALQFGEGYLIVHILNPQGEKGSEAKEGEGQDIHFSEHLACSECHISLPEIEPRTFSFNTPHGACPECQGLGGKLEIDPDIIIPNKELSINGGAIAISSWDGPREEGGWYWQSLEGAARHYKINLDTPVKELPQKELDILLYGSGGKEITMTYRNARGNEYKFKRVYEGVIGNLERRYAETNSEYQRERISSIMTMKTCPSCQGKRLRKEALAVTLLDTSIITVTDWPVHTTLEWVGKMTADDTPLTQRQRIIASRIIRELEERLGFLVSVGLDYLTLDRSAATLSGGEAQRIRLATQIGSRLMGVLYVLDEPSIGLHPRDNARLLRTLEGLRDLGNTVLVVEHDSETIETADWVVDLGPGAGEHGGEVVAEGTVDDILANSKSLTGAYLSGKIQVPIPDRRRNGNGDSIKIIGARQHNLKNIDVEIPLGRLICITGVSGSGKSTLMVDVLYQALAKELHRAKNFPGDHDQIEGLEKIDKVINIDQSPIGRTPRSNPATYTKLFDHIRKLFAELPESKIRGYKPGRFSFNVHGGRCEACQGQGQLRIEMQFLPDVYVPCEVCKGTRFNRETLQVRFKEYSIADVLDMTIERALEVFEAFPPMVNRLQTLFDVGLGYIRVGQPAPTLSGGEAQRVKLARELSKRSTGSTLYVLDEPSVGLHAADVHKLIEVLQRLVDGGNTVLIIEHNLDIIKVADHIIDLGPEGGEAGGEIIAEGTPEDICGNPNSYTGQFLQKYVQTTHDQDCV
ncbi:MAG: excinuclease ABC subunit UvrA [Anaerolineales bacterium]|nr:excinuclease ABC subunit UvrA [Chloroflexota bacterium]MBL6983721.1 excinuclease ABC subunit UvrA [Anaerolineales bacterium]